MTREKIKPDLNSGDLGVNPFVNSLEIEVTKKGYTVMNKFKQEDEKQYLLEKVPFTKVYNVPQSHILSKEHIHINDLPIRCKELYIFILHTLESGRDIFWIDVVRYMNKMEIKSINTYKEAVKLLAKAGYIYPHIDFKDTFWINPAYIFKGSRLNKYPNNVRYNEEKP